MKRLWKSAVLLLIGLNAGAQDIHLSQFAETP